MFFFQYASFALAAASMVCASHMNVYVERAACTTAVAVPKPVAYHCGAQLHLKAPKPIYHSTNDTLEACRTRCLVDTRCISFGHAPHHGDCHAFAESLHDMGASHAQSDMEYYNRHCFATSGDCSPPQGSFTGTVTMTVLSTTTVTHQHVATSA